MKDKNKEQLSDISKRRFHFVDGALFDNVRKFKAGKKTEVKTTSRASTIVPEMVGMQIGVHNGKEYTMVSISEDMIGYRLGEFSRTRTFKSHGGDKNTARAAAAKGKSGSGAKGGKK